MIAKRWIGFAACQGAGLDVERVMAARQRAVAMPLHQVVMHPVLGRQILGQRSPLLADGLSTEHGVQNLRPADPAFRLQVWFDEPPFLVRQIAWASPGLALVAVPVLRHPHLRPP